MHKIFILDTNVILSSSDAIYQFEEHDVVIPFSVIDEIDRFKKDLSGTGHNARSFSRFVDELRAKGSLTSGVRICSTRTKSGKLFIDLNSEVKNLPINLAKNVDNQILSVAFKYKNKFKDKKIIIVSKDTNLRIKADILGIEAEDFEAEKIVNIDDLYAGIRKISVPPELISKFYEENSLELNLLNDEFFPNEFVIMKPNDKKEQEILTKVNYSKQRIETILRAPNGIWGIFPKNVEQALAIDILLDDSIKLVSLFGQAGTGKTLLAVATGLLKTADEGTYNKLLVSRPIFPLGKDIGYLPGNIEEKLNPWMQPIYDNLDLLIGTSSKSRQKRLNRTYQELIHQGLLEVEPLTYIRGRSIPNIFLIVDEAQNLTPHEIKTILTRGGENSKIVLTGDPYQIDNPWLDSSSNGMTYVIDRFKDKNISGHITLHKGERSTLATEAAKIL